MRDIEIEVKHNDLAEAEKLAKEIGCELEVYYKLRGEYVDVYEAGCVAKLVFRNVPKGSVGKIGLIK